jgi:hypothetical protein
VRYWRLYNCFKTILQTKHLGQNKPAHAKSYMAYCSKGSLLSPVMSRRFFTRRAGFHPRLVYMGFVLDMAVLGQVLLRVDCVWKVMAHAQKTDFVFRWKGRVHLNRRGRQFSRLLAAEVCASAVVMLDTPCSQVVWRVLATHSIRQFPLHFPSRSSPCAITFKLDSISGLPQSVIIQPTNHIHINPSEVNATES